MPFCDNNAILAQYEPGIKVNPLRCKRWSCECCHEARCRKLRGEAFRGKPTTFITLTVNPAEFSSPDERARELKKAWVKVRRRAKKGWGNEKIPFLAVYEETEAGEPHLHILCRVKWIPQDWLSEEMQREIGAPVVDIRRINSQKKAARYVSKYVGKAPHHYQGTKRYWRSLDYFVLPPKTFPDQVGERLSSWFERGSVSEIITRYCRKFYRLELYHTKKAVEYWLVDDWSRGSPGEDARAKEPENLQVGFPWGTNSGLSPSW